MQLHKVILFLIAVVAVALSITVTTVTSQSTGNKEKSVATKQKRGELPVVDFASANTPASPQRRAKNKRYDLNADGLDSTKFSLKEKDPEELYELAPDHAPKRSAIPAAQSDAVAICEVVSSEAHLSNDKTDVYSEFTLQVEEVLKNTSEQSVYYGSSLTAERKGGAVRFPSGKVLRRGHLHETMPLAGRRYVFFLRSHSDTGSFSIITGYNLRDGRVFPLDGVEVPKRSPKLAQFAAYEGVEQEAFLNEVRTALAVPVSSQRLVRRSRRAERASA